MTASALRPQSLVARLKHPDGDPTGAWERFAQIFSPLLLSWARQRYGLQPQDAEDMVRDLLADVTVRHPEISHNVGQSFTAFAASLLHQHWLERQRRAGRLPPGIAKHFDSWNPSPQEALRPEERRLIVRRAFELICTEFEPLTWQACWAVVMEGKSPAEAAKQLRMSENAVYVAKQRVLRRLRRELDGILD